MARGSLRWLRRGLFIALVGGVVWATIAFLSFRSAVKERNELVARPVLTALAPAEGPAIARPHVILLVGADASAYRNGQGETGRADTLILLRMDVSGRGYSMLSIPRDLFVPLPSGGEGKINSAYADGGLAGSVTAVRRFTGIEVNHVVQVDFDGFREVVDAVGGITVQNARGIVSSEPFDGKMWRFPRGELELDGRRALAYARIRKTTDARETDLTRAQRQQAVVNAIIEQLVSTDSLLHPRKVPRAVVQPLITDISASQMIAFGVGKAWAKSDNVLRCRLGGDQDFEDGQDVIRPGDENRATIRMWLGRQAPVAPNLAVNPFAPGCVRQA